MAATARVYALLHSGDLVALPAAANSRAEVASGDTALRGRCVGLLERPEELSRVRARLARTNLLALTAQRRRRASVTIPLSLGHRHVKVRRVQYRCCHKPADIWEVLAPVRGLGQLNASMGIVQDARGSHWVTDAGNNRIEIFNPANAFIGQVTSVNGPSA